MSKGVWSIRCAVCGHIADGPPHGTTCFTCEASGLKFCTACQRVLPATKFYSRPDTGKRMAHCADCYKGQRNASAAYMRYDAQYVAVRNRQSAECKRRRYNTENGKIAEIARCHERRGLLKDTYTADAWHACLAYFNHTCAYCGKGGKLTVDHIIPISKFGANSLYNVVPACPGCNSSKCANDILDWYQKQQFYTTERLLKIHSWFKDQQRR